MVRLVDEILKELDQLFLQKKMKPSPTKKGGQYIEIRC